MKNNTKLSVYELGIIKNSLRDRMVNIEELRTDLVTNDDEAETNDNIDAFGSELINIQDKILLMIDKELTNLN